MTEFDAYITQHKAFINKLCNSYVYKFFTTHSTQKVEEVVQLTYIKLWQNFSKKDSYTPEAFIGTCIKSAVTDIYRRYKVQSNRPEIASDIVGEFGAGVCYNAAFEKEDTPATDFYKTLTPQQQQIIEYKMQGLKYAAIAELMGLSEGNIKTIIHRIQQKYKEINE